MTQFKYAWIPDVPDFRDRTFMMTMPLKSLPLSVDLRPGCSPIESQENIGSCTAQALVGALEYNEIRDKTPFADMSRLFLYYNERVIRNTVKVDSGAMLRDGIKALAKTGCCHEHLWPYVTSKFTTKPPVECYTEASTKLITSYNRINSLDEMRLCLAEGSPFVFGFSVYENFESSEVAKTGILGMPSKNESMRGGHAVLCIHEDTLIPLLDGRELTIKELSDEYGENEFYVYSVNEKNKIVAGKAHSIKKTGVNRELVKVILDDGNWFKCTPDHKIMTRDGLYKEAKDLLPNESLMPLYRKLSNDNNMTDYEMVLQPNTNVWQFTHRMVAAYKYSSDKKVIHHKDFNKNNNSPLNLEVMSWMDHTILHTQSSILLEKYSKSEKGRKKSKELMLKLWSDPIWREKTIKQNRENWNKGRKLMIEEGRCGFQALDKDEFSNSCRDRAVELNLYLNLHTPEAEIKRVESRKKHFDEDIEFRNKIQETAILNFKEYNNKVSNGEIKLTEKQRSARSLNALKLAYKRFKQDQFKTFDDYLEFRNEGSSNHKVLKIEDGGFGDVYDLTVDKYHNFGISSGIFVHNCVGYNDLTKQVIVRNSWGRNWGQAGYFMMPYAYIGDKNLADDMWYIKK